MKSFYWSKCNLLERNLGASLFIDFQNLKLTHFNRHDIYNVFFSTRGRRADSEKKSMKIYQQMNFFSAFGRNFSLENIEFLRNSSVVEKFLVLGTLNIWEVFPGVERLNTWKKFSRVCLCGEIENFKKKSRVWKYWKFSKSFVGCGKIKNFKQVSPVWKD